MQTWKDDEFFYFYFYFYYITSQSLYSITRRIRSVLSFPAYKYQEKVSMNFFNGPFRHQEA